MRRVLTAECREREVTAAERGYSLEELNLWHKECGQEPAKAGGYNIVRRSVEKIRQGTCSRTREDLVNHGARWSD